MTEEAQDSEEIRIKIKDKAMAVDRVDTTMYGKEMDQINLFCRKLLKLSIAECLKMTNRMIKGHMWIHCFNQVS